MTSPPFPASSAPAPSCLVVGRAVAGLAGVCLLALLAWSAGCDGTSAAPGSGGGGGGGGGSTGGAGPGGGADACADPATASLGIAQHPDEGNNHLVVCSQTTYHTVPPSSGPHYPSWPVYKTYGAPVPWGFLVHGLEHGAVVVVYNCPDGCSAEVAAAQAWIDALPAADPLCPGEKPRVILAPDPTLDVRWAASAWDWTLRACAFDASMFQPFFDGHYNQSAEKICRGSFEVDQSVSGWCH